MSTTTAPNQQLVPANQKVATIRDLLEKQKKQIALALPKHLSPDRMLRTIMTSIQRTPDLLKCTQESLLAAVMQAAQLGLEPDGVLGKAYLIPRKKKGVLLCNFQTGYKGLIELAYRSGQVSFIAAEVVYQKDFLEVNLGTDRSLKHIPFEPTEDADQGLIRAFYAVAKLKDGSVHFVFMWRKSVDQVKEEFSDAADSEYSPWNTNELTYIEMGKKTVLRRLCKTLPASTELQVAVAIEERQDAGLTMDMSDFIDMPQIEEGQTGQLEGPKSKLDQIVEQQKGKPHNGNKDSAAGNLPNGGSNAPTERGAPLPPQAADNTKPAETQPTPPAAAEDPEATCTDEQFNMLDAVQKHHDVGSEVMLRFVKGALKYKMFSHLKQKDYKRVLRFLQAGGVDTPEGFEKHEVTNAQ